MVTVKLSADGNSTKAAWQDIGSAESMQMKEPAAVTVRPTPDGNEAIEGDLPPAAQATELPAQRTQHGRCGGCSCCRCCFNILPADSATLWQLVSCSAIAIPAE